jgi:hypothetical protein
VRGYFFPMSAFSSVLLIVCLGQSLGVSRHGDKKTPGKKSDAPAQKNVRRAPYLHPAPPATEGPPKKKPGPSIPL